MFKTFNEVYKYREVLINFVKQELTVKYKRSYLGFFWSLLNPLCTMLISSIVFAAIMRFELKDFVIFVYSGLMPWNFFALTIDNASTSLINAEGFIKKIYLPKSIFVLSIVASNLINTLFSTIALFIIMLFIGAKITVALLVLPISFLILLIFTTGISLCIATINVYFRDMRYLNSVVLNAWYYLTPILYPITQIKEEYLLKLFKFNPMYYMVEIFRGPIYEGKVPSIEIWIISSILAVGAAVIGYCVFRDKENDFIFRL